MEQIGLEAVMKTESFMSGLMHFLKGMEDAKQATSNTANAMNGVNAPTNTAAASFEGLTMKSMALAVALGEALYNATVKVAEGLINMAKEGVMAAARTQELDVVLQVLGQRAGIAQSAIDSQVQAIVNYGIQTDVAQGLVVDFIRNQLDLSKATDLARVAQDTAVLSMKDSSEELQLILHGIETMNTYSLRTAYIQVQTDVAMKAYAATLHKTTEELTTNERQQAILNAVLKDGAKNAGIYEAAMETPGKQLRSFTRDMYELTRVMGAPFLSAFGTVVSTMRQIAQSWRTAIDEGGKLHGVFVFLGAIASIVADTFTNFVKRASDSVMNFIAWLSSSFEGAANSAIAWGANIINNLATGIIQAAASALLLAMNYVSNLLASWLKGASPPKVAKDIIKWGANAIAMWMKGMTQADFSVLKDLQAPIKSALDDLVSMGKMKATQVGDVFAKISKAVADALKTGNIGGALDIIRNSTGEYGKELAALAQDEFDLVKAQNAATKAQDELTAAQKAASNAAIKVNDGVNEYNKLLRSGASKEVLDAKLKEINAAKDAQRTAEKDAVTAQDKLTNAQDLLKVLQETRDTQKDLVDQIMAIMQAQIKAAEAAKTAAGAKGGGAKGAGGGLADALGDLGKVGKIDLGTTLSKAVDDAKAKILAKLNELWTSIKTSVMTAVGPYLQPLRDAWDRLSEQIGPSLDKLKTKISNTWEDVKTDASNAWEWLKKQGKDYTLIFEDFWNKHGDSVKTTSGNVWDTVKTYAQQKWDEMLAGARAFWPILVGVLNEKWEEMKKITAGALDFIGITLDLFSGKMKINWEGLWEAIKYKLNNAWNDIKEAVYQALKKVADIMGDAVSSLVQAGVDLIQGIINGINKKLGDLKQLFQRIADSLPDWLKKLLGMSSPSKVFMEIGVNMMEGLAQGIKAGTTVPEQAMRNAAVNVVRPVYSMAGPITNNNINMNMGGFNINNGMDVAMIKTIIRQSVREAVGGPG